MLDILKADHHRLCRLWHMLTLPRLLSTYSARNLEMSIHFSLKSRPSEQFHRPEMSQIKAEISLRTNVKLIFHKKQKFFKLFFPKVLPVYLINLKNRTFLLTCNVFEKTYQNDINWISPTYTENSQNWISNKKGKKVH